MSNIIFGPAQDRPLRNSMKYKHVEGQERKQMRWADFDYSAQGVYFVTIVTQHRTCLFGDVVGDEMVLNAAGQMVMDVYNGLETDSAKCMDIVVMPNHVHFLLYLSHTGKMKLPGFVRDFKSLTTCEYCKGVADGGWPPFMGHLWQRSYWDDIVWNDRMFEFVRRYIALNPSRWKRDAINDDHGSDTDHIVAHLKSLR